MSGLKAVTQLDQRAGFRVTQALMDGKFEPMRVELAEIGVALITTAHDEHIGNIERFIWMIKEQMRAIYNTLPYKTGDCDGQTCGVLAQCLSAP